jgi:hypothetical protein
VRTLVKCKENPQFGQFLQQREFTAEAKGLDLGAFLIMPIQVPPPRAAFRHFGWISHPWVATHTNNSEYRDTFCSCGTSSSTHRNDTPVSLENFMFLCLHLFISLTFNCYKLLQIMRTSAERCRNSRRWPDTSTNPCDEPTRCTLYILFIYYSTSLIFFLLISALELSSAQDQPMVPHVHSINICSTCPLVQQEDSGNPIQVWFSVHGSFL